MSLKSKLSDQLISVIESKMSDPRIVGCLQSIMWDLLESLKTDIKQGRLDDALASALARIATPVIVVLALLFIMIFILLSVSVILLFRVNRLIV